MDISANGLKFIEEREGLRLKPYKDSAGYPTIGVGHLIRPGEHFTEITEAEALEILHHDAQDAVAAINRYVKVPLTQNQMDALTSFTFNLGGGALAKSTLLRRLNAGDVRGAATEFAKWNRAGGRVIAGLTTRRTLEAQLFLQPDSQ